MGVLVRPVHLLLPGVPDLEVGQRSGQDRGLDVGDPAVHHGQQHVGLRDVFDVDLVEILRQAHEIGLLADGDRAELVELAHHPGATRRVAPQGLVDGEHLVGRPERGLLLADSSDQRRRELACHQAVDVVERIEPLQTAIGRRVIGPQGDGCSRVFPGPIGELLRIVAFLTQ